MYSKRIFKVLLIVFLIISPFMVLAEDKIIGEYGSYDNAIKIIQEVMRDYYIREDFLQYNYSRAGYGDFSPEEATNQDNKHLVCASYTYSTYVEAFGVSKNDKFPPYNSSITTTGRDYYNNNKNNVDKLDGNFLIYYENKNKNEKYVYGKVDVNNVSISDFAKIIQPGDLFTYTGHAMIAYQKVYREDKGIWDVLMLNSGDGASIPTRITSTSRLFYHFFSSSHGKNNIIDVDTEGTVRYFWLSESSKFKDKNGNLKCNRDECTVIRPFYKGDNGKAIFNYSILKSQYQKSELRTKYPGLYIEKTINKIDNNSVYLDDELEYIIKITNKSNTTGTGKKYNKFYIKEELGDYVNYVSSEGIKDGNSVVFTIDSLGIDKTVQLKYKVKVKNNLDNIGKIITSVGEFKESLSSSVSITTGTVENIIIPKVSNPKVSYKTCYNNNKNSQKGLALIDAIYKCARGEDFSFSSFKFENLFEKDIIQTKGKANAITIKTNLKGKELLFKNMILNNLWSGLVEISDNTTDEEDSNSSIEEDIVPTNYILPRWSGTIANTRARNINEGFFKDGDVLIYSVDYSKTTNSLQHTKEDGIYAYIYIDGKFVGVNGSGNTERNEFTYQYYKDKSLNLNTHLFSYYDTLGQYNNLKYNEKEILSKANLQTLFDKDYYVVLRPELVIKENDLKSILEEHNYKITDNYVYGFIVGETIKAIKSRLNDNDISITSNIDVIATGTIIKKGNESYVVVIKGDINGDGKIGSLDYIAIRKHMMKQKIINKNTTEYLAADMTDDDDIKAIDYIRIKKIMMGR